MKVLIPGFLKGLVDIKKSIKLGADRMTRATKFTNFYRNKNELSERRPPVESWTDTNINAAERDGIIDYKKLGDQEYFIRGPNSRLDEIIVPQLLENVTESSRNIVTAEYSATIDYRIVKAVGGSTHLFVLLDVTYNSSGDNNRLVIYNNSLELPAQSAQTVDREYELGVGTFQNTTSLGARFEQYNPVIIDTNLPDELFSDERSVYFKAFGLRYELREEQISNNIYETILPSKQIASSINIKREPGNLLDFDINHNDVNIYISKIRSDIPGAFTTSTGSSGIKFDTSLIDLYDSTVKVTLKDSVTTDQTATLVGSGLVDQTKDLINEALGEIRNRLQYVTSVVTRPDNDSVHVFPDIKLRTKHSDARSVCEVLKDNIYSFPERLACRILGNPHNLVVTKRVPDNGGDLAIRQRYLDLLTDISSTDKADSELVKERDQLDNIDADSKAQLASWSFSTAPGTSTTLPSGTADTQGSGIGLCVVLRAANAPEQVGVLGVGGDLTKAREIMNFKTLDFDEGKGLTFGNTVMQPKFNIVIFATINYTSKFVKDWFNDNKTITVPISKDFGISHKTDTGRLMHTFRREISDQVPGSEATEGIGYVYRTQSGPPESVRDASRNVWDRQMLVHLLGINGVQGYEEANGIHIFNYVGGASKMIYPGPPYSLVSGDELPKDPPIKRLPRKHMLNRAFINTASETLADGVENTTYNNSPMASYSIAAYSHSTNSVPTTLENNTLHRSTRFNASNLFISGHRLVGGYWSNPELQYIALSDNIPTNDLLREERRIPRDFTGRYPTYGPQTLDVRKKINTVSETNGDIYVTTDNRVFRVLDTSLDYNRDPALKEILSRGLNSNIVSESAAIFGAQDSQIISVKYYDEAKRFLGFNETDDYTITKITQVETMIQNHNILLCVSGGTDSVFVLSLGKNRVTNGFSKFTLPDIVHKVVKLDHDKLLVLFTNYEPGILDFSRSDGVYLDRVSLLGTVTESRFVSTAASVPIIEIREGKGFEAITDCKIRQAMISLGYVGSGFTFFIESNGRRIIDEEARQIMGSIENITTDPRPYIFKRISQHSVSAPVVGVEVDSDSNFSFSSILLDVEDK